MSDIDWSTEWLTSLLWVLGVTVAAAVAVLLIGWALTRWTVWGRQLRRLAGPYFSPRGPHGVAAAAEHARHPGDGHSARCGCR